MTAVAIGRLKNRSVTLNSEVLRNLMYRFALEEVAVVSRTRSRTLVEMVGRHVRQRAAIVDK